MKIVSITILVLVIAACSNKNPNDIVAVKAGDEYYQVDAAAAKSLEGKTEERVICKRRVVTGSNRKQKICTTQSQIDSDRRDAERVIRDNDKIRTRKLVDEKKGF